MAGEGGEMKGGDLVIFVFHVSLVKELLVFSSFFPRFSIHDKVT